MANFIPKIEYTELYSLANKSFTFDSPPEKDPFKEEIKGVFKETVSTSGNYQRQWNYNLQTCDLEFKYQSVTLMNAFDDFVLKHGLRGGSFKYYPHSDDTYYEIFRLESDSIKKERPLFDDSGSDFLYSFKFSIIRTMDFSLEVEGADMGYGAIAETQFTIANNQTSASDIVGLFFDPTNTRAAFVSYYIYRKTTDTGAVELAEAGTINAVYKPIEGVWELSRTATGDAGVTMTCTALGQFQYTSTNITGTPSVSIIKFKASAIGVEE